jgi:hypothetical protein
MTDVAMELVVKRHWRSRVEASGNIHVPGKVAGMRARNEAVRCR